MYIQTKKLRFLRFKIKFEKIVFVIILYCIKFIKSRFVEILI